MSGDNTGGWGRRRLVEEVGKERRRRTRRRKREEEEQETRRGKRNKPIKSKKSFEKIRFTSKSACLSIANALLLQTNIITSLFLILLQNSYEDIDRKVGVVDFGTLCFKMNTRTSIVKWDGF